MDPGRHHDFLANTDERSSRSTYYGREIPEITAHHYYGPATTTTRPINTNSTRKPCGCVTTGSGTTAGSITCNGCRLNPSEEGGWSTMTNTNQTAVEHMQRGGVGVGGGMTAADYHHRMSTESSSLRSNVRQSSMYIQQHAPPSQSLQQQHTQPQSSHGVSSMVPSQQQQQQHHVSQHVVGTMSGQSRQSYWPQSSGAASTSQNYGPAGDEHMGGLPPPPSQLQIDISVTRRTAPAPHDYGPYKTISMSSSATHNNPHLSSSSGVGGGGGGGVYQLSTSSNSLHSRVSAIVGAAGPGPGPGPNNSPHPYMTKDQQRIYEHQKYSTTSSVTASKLPYNSTPASSAIYDSHHHHHINNQAIGKSLPPTIDHHVINPSNLPASKEQHPSPNYARKCPQMYAPEEQTTAHQHLYMSTPQFSSDKFTRASPQQSAPAPPPPPSNDFSKLRESPSGSAYMVAPHSGDKYATSHLQSSHLRESPQYATHASSLPRNSSSSSSSYYANSQTQNPSKILPPDMSPIIMKQSPHHHPQQHQQQQHSQSHHYQYSKSPLPPPTQPPPPPSHMQTQQTTIPPPHSSVTTQHMAAKTGPPPPPPAPIPAPGHSQRYLMDNVKREDLEIYENPNQTPTRIPSGSSMYINPYNTPPPTGDNCCKEVALSTSSSPYNTGSATPNYRVESPQFYPTKYAKLAMNENLSSSKHSHSLINQNTPPPSRAPSQQRGQHQANYYYEGNSHSAPSPAAATAASPSPSALLTTTSQTPMHHPEYLGPTNMPSQHVYATQPTLAAQHQTPSSAALRHNDLMISVQTSAPPPPTHHTTSHNSYERAIHHPNQPSSAAVVAPPPPPAAVAKHVLTHPTSSTQPPLTGSNPGKPGTKHQKPNYRDLINQTLAIRNATSEEELNMQIIKKTLNVDTQNIRPPPSGVSSRSMASLPSQTHMGVNERIPAPLREPSTKLKSMAPMGSSVLVAPSNIAAAATNLPMPSSARVIEVPEVIPPRICIKQEDDKPSSSSGGTTASSPLDLSMRTVKTKADSTEYKYQQRPTRLAGTTASSTTTPEGRYTLPRVDSTPIFSVHAFEPGAVSGGTSNTVSSRSSSSRHNSLERRIYTPPNQTPLVTQGGGSGSSSSLAGNISPYNPTSTQHNIPNSSTQPTPTQYYGANNEAGSMTPRRSDLAKPLPSQTLAGSYENSLVIKTAPKLNNINSDLVVRPSAITQPNAAPANLPQTNAQPPNRPSVLETNPYASVIKTEPKRYSETPGGVSPRHTLAAVERLPPDTSIMALPARNPYGVVRTAIQTNHNNNNNNNNISSSNPSPQSNYSLACEKNPNFLGRKRHLQEYSQQQMSLNEPEAKLKRYRDLSPQPTPLASTAKPIIPMRPADISVIAVNEVVNMEERKSLLNHNKPRITEDVISNTSVIASTNTNYNSKVIVNNVNHTSNTSSSPSVLMVCKQEPLTPTGEGPQHLNATACVKNEMPANTFSSRIRTKAELKGFTFNPPPLPPSTVEQTPPERNSTPPSPSSSPPPPLPPPPPAEVTIKQEEQEEELDREEESIVHTNVKIKQEVKIDLPSIPGLDDEFEEKSLLDFGWNNTCNNFVEQLLTRPSPKKKTLNLLNHNKTPLKDPDMVVSSTENMLKENNNLSNLESADNTTRSSFNRVETGVDSNFNLNNLNQDSLNSQGSQGFNHKKLSKTEREKKRYHQEKRLAERLKAKDSSSESEDELDKRKTERLKKPLMKAKHKAKTHKTGANSSSSTSLTDKNRFSDCGSDSSGTEIEQQPQQQQKSLNILKDIKQEKMDEEEKEEREKGINEQIKNNEKCDIKTKQDKQEKEDDGEKEKEESNKKKMENKKTNKQETSAKTKEDNSVDKIKQENKSSTETSEQEEDEEDENEDEEQEEEEHKSKTKLNKQALNTMTRSKRKQELEQQLANSKVLRNDKIIRNFSNANSTNKIKRKYTRKYNTVNSLLESGGLSRESGIMKSTRLKAKLERNGGKLNLIKTNITIKQNNLKIGCNKEAANNKLKSPKAENVHDRNDIDLYRFKRALKVPPSLINIKHPGAHKAASLPDLERHAEALEAYAKKREKNCLNKQNKLKSTKSNKHIKSEKGAESKQQTEEQEEPKSIIDLLHSRVTKASGMNVRNKTTTTTAVYRPTKPCCTTSSNNNNCGMFSETSQTTESSELQMLPELKKDSDLEDENDDNDSTNGKKRHFSIFDTKVLPTKTRTESKLQQKKENIREIFVGDDRPASAPPEITQMLDSSEKMTYEQKYEQFLQQMNIVVSADTLGRLSKSAAAKRLGNTVTTNGNQDLNSLNIKQEEGDTESTSVIDADDLKEDQKSLPNHFRKRRGRYLRRKGSSGFDYIRKKKKPSTAANQQQSNVNNQQNNGNNGGNGGGSLSLQTQFNIKSERYDMDEYEHKIKTEDDVSREIQKWVLNKGVGQSTMHKAARQGYIDVIVYCLDRMGMNPDQKDNAGYTPLHEACTNGWLNIARVLLQYGANHSEAAHSGIRPLHEASENDHEEIVRLLLSYGADPLLATYAGQTPLMLASSKSMRDILSNHLIDVQSMGPDRKPWRFNGPWEVYDPSECGYNVFEGAPNSVCDMSRALLRRGSLTNNQMYQNNKKLQNVLNTTTHITNTANATTTNNITMSTKTTTTTAAAATINNLSLSSNTTTSTTTNSTTLTSTSNSSAILNNISSSSSSGSSGSGTGSCTNNNNCNSTNTLTNSNSSSCNPSSSSSLSLLSGIENQQQTQQQQQQLQQQQIKGENSTKTVMEKCAVVLDNIDRFNSVRLFNDNKPEILVENSDSDGEMFEFEEADVLLPPLYLLKDEGTQDKWVLLNDLCNLLKVKSKDTLLNKIYPSTTSSSSASAASAHKSHMRELKMSDFLEKATCLQLLCAGEKLNICASKVVLIKYNENVRNLLGVKTILMKF